MTTGTLKMPLTACTSGMLMAPESLSNGQQKYVIVVADQPVRTRVSTVASKDIGKI